MFSLVFVALLTIAAAFPTRNGFDVGRRSLGRRDSPSVNASQASPLDQTNRRNRSSIEVTPEIIREIFPTAESCSPQLQFPSECRTDIEAAPFVSKSFKSYDITTKAEAAAILSLILFESDGFKFNIHHFPQDNPGQGTRNMMNFPFILEYAHDVLPQNAKKDLPAVNSTDVDDKTKDEVLEKVLGDEFSFATGAWFYQEKCDDPIKLAVRTGSEDGWRLYIEKCVGTSVTDARQEGWNKTMSVI